MIYIACHSTKNKNVELSEIAEEQEIPKHFLSKILQLLVKHKLLESMKGPTGGFKLSRPSKEVTLIEVVEAIDGLDIFSQCGIGFRECDETDPCVIHDDYKKIRERVYHLFKNKTLEGLREDLKNGDSIVELDKMSEKE